MAIRTADHFYSITFDIYGTCRRCRVEVVGYKALVELCHDCEYGGATFHSTLVRIQGENRA